MEKKSKKYYWLKLKDDFFRNPKIKKLRKIAGGDTYTIILQKIMLLSVSAGGVIEFQGIEKNFSEELALILDEDTVNVEMTLSFMLTNGLIENLEGDVFILPFMPELIGSESDSAERVRRLRERKNGIDNNTPKKVPTTNSDRQRRFRAKSDCEKQHIPMIEDHQNNKRYGGNYYIVMKRDGFSCAECKSIYNLCVHHIDGFDELKPENSNENKMVCLCRKCHSNVHSGKEISGNTLLRIDYSNEIVTCNTFVTTCNTEIRDKRKENKREELDKRDDSCDALVVDVVKESDFDLFWNAYPKKVGKDAALKAWSKKKGKPSIHLVLEAIERYKLSKAVHDGFTCNPATWINEGRWSDEYKEYSKNGVLPDGVNIFDLIGR